MNQLPFLSHDNTVDNARSVKPWLIACVMEPEVSHNLHSLYREIIQRSEIPQLICRAAAHDVTSAWQKVRVHVHLAMHFAICHQCSCSTTLVSVNLSFHPQGNSEKL